MQFRVTGRPRDLSKPLVRVIQEAAEAAAEEAKKKLEEVTKDWSDEVKFTAHVVSQRGKIVFSVLTNSEIYNWVDKGTEPHRIPKGGSARMSFRLGYIARTRRNSLRTTAGGGVSTGAFVGASSVNHPGIEARNLTSTAGRGINSRVEKEVNKQVRRMRL